MPDTSPAFEMTPPEGEEMGRRPPGQSPEAASAADEPTPGRRAHPSAEADGRRILSAAFVRLGAGELLEVELRDGRVARLRDVAMGRASYCGTRASGPAAGKRFCGGYADVAAARTTTS